MADHILQKFLNDHKNLAEHSNAIAHSVRGRNEVTTHTMRLGLYKLTVVFHGRTLFQGSKNSLNTFPLFQGRINNLNKYAFFLV